MPRQPPELADKPDFSGKSGLSHVAELLSYFAGVPLSLFCLVHGSTQNASCWDLIIPELEQRGREVVRMNLPTKEPETSATRYADLIAEAIPAHRDDAVVVAHAASGLFLALAPQTHRVRFLRLARAYAMR